MDAVKVSNRFDDFLKQLFFSTSNPFTWVSRFFRMFFLFHSFNEFKNSFWTPKKIKTDTTVVHSNPADPEKRK